MIVLFRAKKTNGTLEVLTTETLRLLDMLPYSAQRCTMLVDSGEFLIYEGDYVEIYDNNGDVLYSGTVIYSDRKAAFLLVDENGKDVSDQPLGALCKDHIFHKVVRSDK